MDRFSDDYRPSSRRRAPDALEDGLDRLVTAGRQLVDGVSGARPGSRRRAGASGGASLPRLGELGRWVEERLDGLLDADDEDWREPWQDARREPIARAQAPALQVPAPSPEGLRRRPLEAISRRVEPPATPALPAAGADAGEWPGDDVFTLRRWQRDPRSRQAERAAEQQRTTDVRGAGRPLPRSSRRR
jgi:hypothetical protein